MPSRTGPLGGSLIVHAVLALVLSSIRSAAPVLPQVHASVTLSPVSGNTMPAKIARRPARPPRTFIAPAAQATSAREAVPALPHTPAIASASPPSLAIASVEAPPPMRPPPAVPTPPRTPVAAAYSSATVILPRVESQANPRTGTFPDAITPPAVDQGRRKVQTGSFDGSGSGASGGSFVMRRALVPQSEFEAVSSPRLEPRARQMRASGFSDLARAVPPTTPATALPTRAETGLEILSKPRPAYSEEARRMGLEGDVILEAVFQASGRVHVLRVIHGLGHGLDENAVLAAGGIRFRPAAVNGAAVDMVANVRVTFQLAN